MGLTPVDYDPFASVSQTEKKLTPVDYDPFASSEGTNQGILDATHGGAYGAFSDKASNMTTFGLMPPAYSAVIAGANKLRDTVTGQNQNKSFGDYYDNSMDRFVAKNQAQGDMYPNSSIAGNTVGVLGGLGGGAVNAGENIVAQAPNGLGAVFKQLGLEGVRNAAFSAPIAGLNALGYAKGDTSNRLEQGVEGLAAGGALGLMTPFAIAGAGKAIGAAARPLSMLRNATGMGDAQSIAEQKVLDIARRSGKNIDDVLAELQSSQKPVGLADLLGDPGTALAGTAYRNSQEGRSILADSLNNRTAQSGDRLSQDLSETLTNNQNPYATSQTLIKGRSENAQPLYEKAFNSGPVNSDRIQEFLSDPELKSGISRGLKIQRLEARAKNEPFNPKDYAVVDFNEAGDPILGQVPNMRLLDAGKRGLDAMIADNIDQTGRVNELGKALIQYKNSYLQELDSLNPSYKAARSQFSGESDVINAVRQGQDTASKGKIRNISPEKIIADTSKLNEAGKQGYATGIAGQLRQEGPQSVRSQFGRGINQGEDQLIPNLRTGFQGVGGNFDEFANRQLQEVQMAATKNKIMGGSPTAEKLADDMNLGGMDMVKSVVKRDPLGFTQALLKSVDRANGFNEKTGAEVAKLLAPLNTAERMKVIKQLTDANTKTSKSLAKYISRFKTSNKIINNVGTQSLSGIIRTQD